MGHSHGSKPFGENETEKTIGPHHAFNFPTDMPFKGVHGLSGDVTQQPGMFFRPIFGNRNQQEGRGSQRS